MAMSKTVRRLFLRRNSSIGQLTRYFENNEPFRNAVQIRIVSSIAGIESSPVNKLIGENKDMNLRLGRFGTGGSSVQKRGFLGCGDGEEGNPIAKVYEEKRVLGLVFLLFFFVHLSTVSLML